MNCYFSRNYKDLNSAGNKAKTDIEYIISSIGFKNIGCRQQIHKNKILSYIITLFSVLKTVILVKKSDILVIQYPLKKYFTFVCKITHFKGGKIIVIIHDLGCFRRKKLTKEQEIKRLNNADYIIAHNLKMTKWLRNNGCSAKIEELEIFDYLSDTVAPIDPPISNKRSIFYAGALNDRKNKFLYDIEPHIKSFNLNLYGNGFKIEKVKNKELFNYMGFVRSDKLIENANGDFGLVWDGNSLYECTGDFGEYLKINNPHKVSLYIRCNTPVIIWKEAALADFVKSNNIGICIESLTELDTILSSITLEEYAEMKKNTIIVSERLRNGYYIKTAITKGIKSIS